MWPPRPRGRRGASPPRRQGAGQPRPLRARAAALSPAPAFRPGARRSPGCRGGRAPQPLPRLPPPARCLGEVSPPGAAARAGAGGARAHGWRRAGPALRCPRAAPGAGLCPRVGTRSSPHELCPTLLRKPNPAGKPAGDKPASRRARRTPPGGTQDAEDPRAAATAARPAAPVTGLTAHTRT